MRIASRTCAKLRWAPALLALVPPLSVARAAPCLEWRAPEQVGTLDPQFLPEESGIAASRAYAGRYYHINDSGDGPYVYLTGLSGGPASRIAVSGFVPRDVEDIALGPCAGAAACLFLGDIGDNAANRASVTFVEIAEQDAYAEAVAPLRTIAARYPNGPHNAEAFAIHPNGDLYLVTKAADRADGTSVAAQIFRLTAAQLAGPGDTVQTFALVGSVDLPRYIPSALPRFVRGLYSDQVVTAMDISADGTRTLMLTYRQAFEWSQDLAQPFEPDRPLESGRDYTVTPLAPLPQAEAVAYLPAGDGIVYSTEAAGGAAPVYTQVCARR